MKNKLILNGKEIELSDETADNIYKALGIEQNIKFPVSMGDRFERGDSKYLMGCIGCGKIALINLKTGRRGSYIQNVVDIERITRKEFEAMIGFNVLSDWKQIPRGED